MIRHALASLRRSLRPPTREDGLAEEVAFWREFLRTKGLQWPGDYQRRCDPTLPLQRELWPYIETCPRPEVAILDVGAGPLTKLGKTHPTKTLHITAVDVLAPQYDALLAEAGVTPLVRTLYADAEQLAAHFPPASFDLVYAQNTLDHMVHPLRALDAMAACVRPGGWLVLRHEENEGKTRNYQDLHGWDCTLDDATGHFVVRDRAGHTTDVTARMPGPSTTTRDGNLVVWAWQRG